MKEIPIIDVFDTTDFNPELILSNVFLDHSLDRFVANIDELSDNTMVPDILQHLGSSVYYSDNTSSVNHNSIEDYTADQFTPQHVQCQLQQQGRTEKHQQASNGSVTVEKNSERLHCESIESEFTKLLPSIVPSALAVQEAQQQALQLQSTSAVDSPQQQQPCKCEFCEYLQANRISLTGDHAFQCEFCGEGFSNQTTFNRHRCGSTDIQMYRCESCRKEYGSSRAVSSLGNSEQRDKCDLCNRTYGQSHSEEQTAFGLLPVPVALYSSDESETNKISIRKTDPTGGLPHTAGRSLLRTAFPTPVIKSPIASSASADILHSTVNVQYNLDSSAKQHALSNFNPFESESECTEDFFASNSNETSDIGLPSSMVAANSKTNNIPAPPNLHNAESSKTYFVLGNVEQIRQCQQTRNSSSSSNATINLLPAPNNFYHSQHLSPVAVPHPLLPNAQSIQNALPSVLLPSEHEVTSLHQYDQYDDDYSSMSEDEAIVPIEPYAKSPTNQEHAKTELPVQETIVDTSSSSSTVQFTVSLKENVSSTKLKALNRALLVHGTRQVHQQNEESRREMQQQQQQQLQQPQQHQPNIDAITSLSGRDDIDLGKCDSSSSSLRTVSINVEDREQHLESNAALVSNSTIERPYKCHICERSYRNQKNLRSHLKVHDGIRAYQCEICGKNFSGSSYLVIHRRRHTGERPFKCATCGKAFVDSRALAVHTRLHSGDRLKCEKCEKTFSSVSALTVHNRLHTGIHPYKCEFCGKTFPQYNNLKHHLKKHDPTSGLEIVEKSSPKHIDNWVSISLPNTSVATSSNELEEATKTAPNQQVARQTSLDSSTNRSIFEYKCHICSKLHKSSGELQEHLNQHSKDRPNQCEFCAKVFPRSSHLIIHRRRHTGERPFKCKYCDKAFVDSRALSVHTRLHTGERVKCEICEKTFASSSGLIVHRRIHTGVHPYKCDYCEKSFAQSTALKYHLKKHDTALLPTTTSNTAAAVPPIAQRMVPTHDFGIATKLQYPETSNSFENNERHKCPICNKHFRSSEYLVRHRRTHNGERPYQCEICGKNFSTMSYLVIHRRRHTSERPYKCNSCEKAFVDSRALQEHARLHTGDRVRCEICQKTYSSISNLIVHRRIHSGVHPFECDSCGKSFAQKNALKYHLKKHKKQE